MAELKDIYNFYSDWFDAITDAEFDGCHYGRSVEELHTGVNFDVFYIVGLNRLLRGLRLLATHGKDFSVEINTETRTFDVYDFFGHSLSGSIPPKVCGYIEEYFIRSYDGGEILGY